MFNGLFYFIIWTVPCPVQRVLGLLSLLLLLLLLFLLIREVSVFNANSVDPDQTPHDAASDLGPYFLQVPLLSRLGINGLG